MNTQPHNAENGENMLNNVSTHDAFKSGVDHAIAVINNRISELKNMLQMYPWNLEYKYKLDEAKQTLTLLQS